jgi:hypothetical protein
MAQLAVRYKGAVVKECGADAGPEGDHDHQTWDVLSRSPLDLRHAGGIRVVDGGNREACGRAHDGFDIGPDPALVDVGGRAGDPVLDNGGEGAAERTLPPEVLDELGHYFGHRVRYRWLRGQKLEAFSRQKARLDVHDGALYTGAAYVDPEAEVGHAESLTLCRPGAGHGPRQGGLGTAGNGRKGTAARAREGRRDGSEGAGSRAAMAGPTVRWPP